jgi:hypothetical protein
MFVPALEFTREEVMVKVAVPPGLTCPGDTVTEIVGFEVDASANTPAKTAGPEYAIWQAVTASKTLKHDRLGAKRKTE